MGRLHRAGQQGSKNGLIDVSFVKLSFLAWMPSAGFMAHLLLAWSLALQLF